MAKSSKGIGSVEADIIKSDALKWRCIGPSRGGRVCLPVIIRIR